MPRIHLMGEVALFVEDQPIQLRSTKELGLLAILAEAHPRPITRNYLLELLWPESEPDRARRSLNQAVYAIRQVVGQDALRPQLDLLALAGSDWTCDLWELDDLVAEAARTKTPLDRFARGGRLPSTELFRDWAERAGARVDAYLVSAYCGELGKLMDRGRFEAVEPIARAVLQIDPYAETGLYHLALAIARSGRITAGLQELAKARARFRNDLDRDLPAAFDTLEESLRSAEAFEASRRPKGGRDATVFPFVGREEEFAHLRSAWDGIAETGRRIVLISGEPGIGKTRLVDRLARLASIEGGRVLHAECFAAHKRVAFAAISEALRGLRPEEIAGLDSIWRRVLFSSFALEAVGTDLKPPPRLDPEAEQLRLFESATLAVQAAAAKRPVLVVVDDLQWLDQSSAAVLQHMIRRCEDDPVLFVLAARERELRVDEELRQFIANNRGAAFADIELGVLNEAAAGNLVVSAPRNSTISSGRALAIAQRLGFHPFLITAMLREAQSFDHEAESPDSVLGARLPASVSQHFKQTFFRLGGAARRLATTLAVSATPSKVRDILGFAGFSAEEHLVETLDALVGDHILVVEGDSVRFRHDLYRDWLYSEATMPRRCAEHARIGAWLAAQENPDHAQIAAHFDAAGISQPAYRHGMLAAAYLEKTNAFDEAEHFLRLAVRHAPNEARRHQAEFQLAEHLFLHAGQAESSDLYERLATLSAPHSHISLMANARLVSVEVESGGVVFEKVGERALRIIDRALAHKDVSAAAVALGAATRCLWYGEGVEAECHRVLAAARKTVEMAGEEGLEEVLECERAEALVVTLAGDRDSIPQLAGVARQIGLSVATAPLIARICQTDGFLSWMIGDLPAAEAQWSMGLRAAEQSGHLSFVATNKINLAVVRHYRGASSQADPLLREAEADAQRRGLTADVYMTRANRALFAWENKEPSVAWDLVRGTETLAEEHQFSGKSILQSVHGLLQLSVGARAEAERCLAAAVHSLFANELRSQDPSPVLHLARRLARSEADLEECQAMAARALARSARSKVCLWKIDLELARVARRKGAHERGFELADSVRQAARAGGAERLVRDAEAICAASERGNPARVSSLTATSRTA